MENNKNFSKSLIHDCIHSWGSPVVDSILDPSCRIFSVPGLKGLIGYYTNHGCIVAFGDPLCAPQDLNTLVRAFHEFCDRSKKNLIYLVASDAFTNFMHHFDIGGIIPFGSELFVDPYANPLACTGKKGISLRGKIRQAKKHQIVIEEYEAYNPELEHALQDVANRWLKSRSGPQIYISRVRLFDVRYGKRWFYAKYEGSFIGCIVLNRLQVRGGWVLDRIMVVPGAPQGTSEFLVLSIMETIAQEGCHFLSFGAINGSTLGTMQGFGKCTAFLANYLYALSLKVFHLQSRGKYWEKFQPLSAPAYLIFRKAKLGFYEVRGLLNALNVSFFNKV